MAAFSEDELKRRIGEGFLLESPDEMTEGYRRAIVTQLTVQGDTELISAPAYWMAAQDAPSTNTQVTVVAIIQDELAHAVERMVLLAVGLQLGDVALLPGHARWAKFFSRLRYVVVDECHQYRGVFGAHVAQILRRLRRVCSVYGASPTFVLASATVAEPEVSASTFFVVQDTTNTIDMSSHVSGGNGVLEGRSRIGRAGPRQDGADSP